jgi:DNA topoisomerase-1
MKLVVVESPAKAKTINKYLGSGYQVVPSYGHVRDLPAKDGSVQPDQDFALTWEVDPKAAKRLKDIADAAKDADGLILATDPDREGEAISWHVLEVLKQKGVLKSLPVERVVFNAITKSSVKEAMANPRQIDAELVDAYLARRALDYLVGFTLSPVLWRKLPGARSAGRVQSVALRLITERELEIEAFKAQEYWTIDVDLGAPSGAEFTARLSALDGKKLDKFSLGNEGVAQAAADRISSAAFTVDSVESKPAKRHPAPPFITSTLQQEAARKLGFSAKHTMQIAQRLYEGIDLGGETIGLITYMRTDGVDLAPESLREIKTVIEREFGAQYASPQPRTYKSKVRNAQEAHEAIRPTDASRLPADLKRFLDSDQLALYDLVWKRTVACQMESAELERTTIEILSADKQIGLRATGSVVTFDGFLKVYQEGRDEPEDDESGSRLPKLNAGDNLDRRAVRPEQHFTEPPPRYSEASLVKKLEELGIGRPSTYASILSTLRDRAYVRMDRNRFLPEDKGRLVTAFLTSFFKRYVEYDFTADLEEKLDAVSAGNLGWKDLLRDFWTDFAGAVKDISTLRVSEVLDAVDEIMGPHIFPAREDGTEPRKCPNCGNGRLGLKLGKFGAFIGCSNYPECNFTRPLAVPEGEETQERILGLHPDSGEEVALKVGRFGPYVQLGKGDNGEKPKRAGIPKGQDPAALTLERALELLSLPREVGIHPETQKTILAGLGRFGPYLNHDGSYASLDSIEDVFTIGINHAVTILAEKKAKGFKRRGPEALRELGPHPASGDVIKVMSGRYGPYVTDGNVNATLPQSTTPEAVTLEQAIQLIDARIEAGGGKKPKKKAKAPAKTAKAKEAKDGKEPKKKETKKKDTKKAEAAAEPAKIEKAAKAAKTTKPKAAKAKTEVTN